MDEHRLEVVTWRVTDQRDHDSAFCLHDSLKPQNGDGRDSSQLSPLASPSVDVQTLSAVLSYRSGIHQPGFLAIPGQS